MDLSNAAAIAQIVSVVGGILFGLWKIWRKIDQHQANSQARSDVIETRLDRIEAQFGPNGGGLREAVNRISKTVDLMNKKIDHINRDVAHLQGEFKQHIREDDQVTIIDWIIFLAKQITALTITKVAGVLAIGSLIDVSPVKNAIIATGVALMEIADSISRDYLRDGDITKEEISKEFAKQVDKKDKK